MLKIKKNLVAIALGCPLVFWGGIPAVATKYVSVFTYQNRTKFVVKSGESYDSAIQNAEKACLAMGPKEEIGKCVQKYTGKPEGWWVFKYDEHVKVQKGYPDDCKDKITKLPGISVPKVKRNLCGPVQSLKKAAGLE